MDDAKNDLADARRWRALVRFWRESQNPTDVANYIPDLLETDADELEAKGLT